MYRIALITLGTIACSGTSGSVSSPGAQTGPTSTANARADAQPEINWQSPLQREHALVGKIWDARAGQFATRAELAERARTARFVLIGETHDNADHHTLQAAIIDMVTGAQRTPALVFEMIDSSQQAAIDAHLQTAPDDVDGLGQVLKWDSSGWPPWSIYRPVFASALSAHLPVIGAALPRARAMELATGKSQLPDELVARYRLAEPLPGALHQQLIDELVASHCGHMPAAMMAPMAGIQRARDAIMADGLATRATEGGAILIAGGGHVRADRGVPWYLRQGGHTKADILTIGLLQVAADATAPADYAERYDGNLPFDYVWFTPVANDIDRCAELEKRMKEMKAKKPHGAEAPAGEQ